MKYKDIQKLSVPERAKKLKELKMELIKSTSQGAKKGSARTNDIKRIIARIHTLNVNVEGKNK